MQTLSSSEIKRRGIVAVDKMISKGPVHIIKNNELKYVVLSEKEYKKLIQRTQHKKQITLSDMLEKPASGKKKRSELDEQITSLRKEWK